MRGWATRIICRLGGALCLSLGLLVTPATANDELGATIYGQLNFGAMQVDNGSGRQRYFAENPSIPSRVGIVWMYPLNGPSTLSFRLETGLGPTSLRNVSPTNDDLEFEFRRTVLRKFEVVYASDRFGQLSVGQGSMTSDGTAGSDLSGTSLAIGPGIGDLGGGTEFLAPNGTGSGVFVGDVFDDLGGLRRLRVRYDMPEWNGFTLAFAHGVDVLRRGRNRDYTDVAITYALDADQITVEAAASYEWIDATAERAVGSASVLHKRTGLNASVATGANQIGDGGYVYAKLGVIKTLSDLGPTAFAVEYYDGNDLGFAGSNATAMGIAVTQKIAPLNLDLVGTVRRYQLSSPTAVFQDIDIVMLAARWRF